MLEVLLTLTTLFPLAVGAYLFFGKFSDENTRNRFVTVSLVVSFVLCLASALMADGSFALFYIAGSIPIAFGVDATARLFGVLSAAMWLVAGLYSFGYFHGDEDGQKFYGFYLGTLGAILGVCFAATPVTMYLFFELMTLISLGLVLHNKQKAAVAAGVKYLLYSIAGAMMGLFGIFYFSTGQTTPYFVSGGSMTTEFLQNNPTLVLCALFVTIIGFGTKAGMFPMHGWLPTAHPVAPAPASAVMSGVITKMGVLCVVRMIFDVVGVDVLRGTWVQTVLLSLSLATVFMGSMMAMRVTELKKRLAFSSVSQVSYVLFGIFTLSEMGMTGAMMHMVFHSIMKNALFLCAGSIIHQSGYTDVKDLTGLGKRMPVTMWCFAIASIGLVGVPPLSGFLSKWVIARGALESSIGVFSWLGPVVLLISALLTAGYLLPICVNAFFPGKVMEDTKSIEVKGRMLWTVVVLAGLTVLFGVWAEPVQSIAATVALYLR